MMSSVKSRRKLVAIAIFASLTAFFVISHLYSARSAHFLSHKLKTFFLGGSYSSPRIPMERRFRFLFGSCQRRVNITTKRFVFKSLHFVHPKLFFCSDADDDITSNFSVTNVVSSLSASSAQQFFKSNKLGELDNDWDVVVFNVHDMPGPTTLKKIRRNVSDNQLWAYYNRESPFNTINLIKKKFDGIFNLTMTPLRESDVMTKYGYYRERQQVDDDNNIRIGHPLNLERVTFKKNRTFVWISSHCNLQRDALVASINRYVNIDIYGKCARKFKSNQQKRAQNNCVRFTGSCEAKLRQYKFLLAFENSMCKDYVTEKYWDAIYRGSIPVVYGGSRYDAELVIPKSFINVRDFKSVRALVSHLQDVSSNTEAYMRYHAWRRDYVIDYDPTDRHRFDILGGELWKLLNGRWRKQNATKFPKKVYKLSKFYSRRKHCKIEKRF